MISKELLSEVLNIKVKNCYKLGDNPNYSKSTLLYSKVGIGELYGINIYELAHKCKEWLLDNGYYIKISPFKVELFEKDTNSFVRDFHYPIQDKAIPYDIKRIIQCCQWILDNKES